MTFREAIFDLDVTPLDEATLVQALMERAHRDTGDDGRFVAMNEPNHRHLQLL